MLSLCKLKLCWRHGMDFPAHLFSSRCGPILSWLLRCCLAVVEAASLQTFTGCHVLTAGDPLTCLLPSSVEVLTFKLLGVDTCCLLAVCCS